jgi:phosphatidylglycerol lysyltransferase
LIRKWLFPLLTVGFIWVLFSRLSEIEELGRTIAQMRWEWVLTAVGLQVIFYFLLAASYKAAFNAANVNTRLLDLPVLTLAAIFINTAAPSSGTAGVALFVDYAKRRGESRTRATMGFLLQMVVDTGIFFIILAAGMVILFIRHALSWYGITAALLLTVYTLAIALALTLGLWRPQWLHVIFSWLQKTANRVGAWVRRPVLLAEGWSERNANEFIEASRSMAAKPLQIASTILFALASHAVALLVLYTFFISFGQPVTLEILIAGYSMAILFTTVSPGGAGIVDGLMPIIFVSLGIPLAEATVVSLAFRGASFWLPLLLGFVLLRRLPLFTRAEQSAATAREHNLAALAVMLMGIINVLSGITPAIADRVQILAQLSPLQVRWGGQFTMVFMGFVLLMLGGGLWRRKRVAWFLAMIVLSISAISHLIRRLDFEEAVLALLLVVYLWVQRQKFQALSDPPSYQQGIWALIGAFLFTLSYGTVGFYILDRHFIGSFDFEAALQQTIRMFTDFYNPRLWPITAFGRYFAASIYAVGIMTVAYALGMLLRPVIQHGMASQRKRAQAQKIVEKYAHSAVARFALFPDKSYWFSPGGSVVAYAAHSRTAVALGDPIGPQQDMAAAITGFAEFCSSNRWNAAFYQTLPDCLELYREAGFNVLCIGEEGIVELATFSRQGLENREVVAAVERLNQAGYRSHLHRPTISDAMLAELRSVSDEWLANLGARERRFDLGWFDESYVRSSPIMAIHAPDGSVAAFANIVTEYRSNEVTLDLVRYRGNLDEGILDYLFIALLEWAKRRGFDSFNLGLSPLSGVSNQPADPAVEPALRYVYDHVSHFYNFKGIHEFKEKFSPTWAPRYLVFPGYNSLPAVGYTIHVASAGRSLLFDYASDLIGRGHETLTERRAAAAQARARKALAALEKATNSRG